MTDKFPCEICQRREYNPVRDGPYALIGLGAVVIGFTALTFETTSEGNHEVRNTTYTIMQKYDLNKDKVLQASELDKLLTDFNNKNK